MAVSISAFGALRDGRKVNKITLKNAAGTQVSVLDYGATLQSFVFDGKDILLGYDTIEGYVNANGSYIGATVGRFCNRIANGRFMLGDKEVQVACNEVSRHCHLHGGMIGFDKKIWSYEILSDDTEPAVCFTLTSPDGDENYPGTLQVRLTVTLTADNTLSLAYNATTDRDTVVNLTNHSYFNINGYDGDNILDTLLTVNADEITPVDEGLIPTGEFLPVEGTPLDFRHVKPMRDGILGTHPQIAIAGGIDHNFVLAHGKGVMREAACAYSEKSGIRLVCSTDLPGLQIYTANFLNEQAGKNGHCWSAYGGFCLETQYFPDSVNQPNFPSVFLAAGEEYTSRTDFHVDHCPIER